MAFIHKSHGQSLAVMANQLQVTRLRFKQKQVLGNDKQHFVMEAIRL